ncbi:DUF3769 domain-containing protein [Leptolyngbya ohadii]|uniref:DUF3769 domain-containing protein n=1 Tax=Leptolyngbya ohadii TaxID=1962290 RepID=UPI000B59B16A|nr:DUF3769 domain-containing protein [Leptolyngbya ohadii]
MPYPVPPSQPPVIHQISQNSSTVSPQTAPDAAGVVNASDPRLTIQGEARSLGGTLSVEQPESARVSFARAQSAPVESRRHQREQIPFRSALPSLNSELPNAQESGRRIAQQPPAPANSSSSRSSPVSIRPLAELDALIAVTRARAAVPSNQTAPSVDDVARSGQIAPQVPAPGSSASTNAGVASPPGNPNTGNPNVGEQPSTTAPGTSSEIGGEASGEVTDGQVLTIPGQGEAPADPTPTAGQTPAGQTPAPGATAQPAPEVIELSADRQEFDERRQVFLAEGNVVMRFRQAILSADRLQVNIPNRLAVADGDGVLQRGQQTLRGQEFTYNFGLDQGSIQQARGDLALGAAADFDVNQPPVIGSPLGSLQSVGQQVSTSQPLQVGGSTGGLVFGVGDNLPNPPQQEISRLRFEADQLQFSGPNWEATNVRLTNDPFSPPELELRSPRVTFTPLSPTSSEIRARNPRVVFDQGFSLPLLIDRAVISQERRNPGLFNFGYDERDRGGFFIERTFNIVSNPIVNFSVTPQILVQRALTEDGFLSGSAYGLIASLTANPTPTTSIVGNAVFTSLDLEDLENTFRASLRAQQRIFANHTLALEYSYRDRLFNGSLGFQNVQSSLGFVITSPNYTLGQTGITLNYQGGVQFIDARTDRIDLLLEQNGEISTDSDKNRVDLTRYQISATLARPILLWAGTPLPPTPTEGLRYTPNPVVPYVALVPSVRGVYSGYSSNDTQASLTGSIALAGQFGHFSRPFLDYTAFNVSYSRTALDGQSPFLFDRVADEQVLSAGITQQIYGPIRFGVQASYNLDTGDNIDTVYTLEYSRRTYSLTAAYSPRREAASLVFRLFDFNWSGDPGPFSGVDPGDNVIDGVRQRNLQR